MFQQLQHKGSVAVNCCSSVCRLSVVVAHRLSYSATRGILPDQGSNPRPPSAGGFLSTASPGKCDNYIFFIHYKISQNSSLKHHILCAILLDSGAFTMTLSIGNLPQWNPVPEMLPLILLTPVTQDTLSSPGSDNHQTQTSFKDIGEQFPLGHSLTLEAFPDMGKLECNQWQVIGSDPSHFLPLLLLLLRAYLIHLEQQTC